MKFLVICGFLSAFVPVLAHAVTFSVTGKNGANIFSAQGEIDLPTTVGKFTVEMLKANNISYVGDEDAISSIANIDQEMVVISDTETKAYGWCYSVDGVEPNAMPDEMKITQQSSKVEWYYGYAHYKNGAWITQCKRD